MKTALYTLCFLSCCFAGIPSLNLLRSSASPPAAISLGEAPLTRSSGVLANPVNPAGIFSGDRLDLHLGYSFNPILGISVTTIAAGDRPKERIARGVSIYAIDIDDIEFRNETGISRGSSSYKTSIMTFSAGYTPYDGLQVGANCSVLLSSEYKTAVTDGLILDGGFIVKGGGVSFGMSCMGVELFSKSDYYSKNSYAVDIRLGPSFELPLGASGKNILTLYGTYLTSGDRMSAGAELSFANGGLALRGGLTSVEWHSLQYYGGVGIGFDLPPGKDENGLHRIIIDQALAYRNGTFLHSLSLSGAVNF